MIDLETMREIVESDYAVPAERTLDELTPLLLSALGAPDPEIREPAPEILDVWIERGMYSPTRMRSITNRLLDNLEIGLGEQGTDAVFLRTFSLLVLTSIISRDITSPFLEHGEVVVILDRVLHYSRTERDLRGYIQELGWAHSVAHTGDVLWVLASHPALDEGHLERVLADVAHMVAPPISHVYLHNEEERLAHAVVGVLSRHALTGDTVDAWFDRLGAPNGQCLDFDALSDDLCAVQRHNTLAFLRALYLQINGTTPWPVPDGLPAYLKRQILDAPDTLGDTLPAITRSIRAISIF